MSTSYFCLIYLVTCAILASVRQPLSQRCPTLSPFATCANRLIKCGERKNFIKWKCGDRNISVGHHCSKCYNFSIHIVFFTKTDLLQIKLCFDFKNQNVYTTLSIPGTLASCYFFGHTCVALSLLLKKLP